MLSALALLVTLAVLFQLRKQNKSEALEQQLLRLREELQLLQRQSADEFERGRRESGAFQKELRAEIGGSLKSMDETLRGMTQANFEQQQRLAEQLAKSLGSLHSGNRDQNERQSRMLAESLTRMQESNEKRLEQMRATVDEKLQATLAARLDSSFKTVSEQLENVYKSLGEMKELSSGVTSNVTSLNRILTNVKARGTWAEVQLEGILDQTIPGMYERNFAAVEGSRERVEFAIRIPTGEDGRQVVYLPVDSKFPMEDYVRLCDAADAADAEALQRARKALEDRVLQEARDIMKYIHIPRTTPYAILYLATEGLYAEIASARSGLPERLRSECDVMIAGPTTITALLSSLAMGFRAVAINEKANEVRLLLAAAKKQYDLFGDMLEKAKRKIDEAGRSLSDAQHRNSVIQKKLRQVESIDSGSADTTLGIAESTDQ